MLLVVLIAVEVAVAATVEARKAAAAAAVGARKAAAAVAGISKMWLPVSRDLRVG